MSKNILDIVNKRRNSYLGPENFKRRAGIMVNSPVINSSKETFDLLQQESEKLKSFLKKIALNDSIISKHSAKSGAVPVPPDKKISNPVVTPKKKILGSRRSLKHYTVSPEFKSIFQYNELNSSHISRDLTEKQKDKDSQGQLSESFFDFRLISSDRERVLRKMDKIEDSDGLEDHMVDCAESCWVIFPESGYIRFWEKIIFVCLLYLLIVDTFVLGFLETEPFCSIIISIVIELLFIIDLVSNFFIAYYDFNEDLVVNSRQICMYYLTDGFIVDLLAAIPFTIALCLFNSPRELNLIHVGRLNKLAKFSRALRLTRLVKVFNKTPTKLKIKFIERLNNNSNLKRFVMFFVYFLFVNHVSTCIWVFIGRLSYPNWILDADLIDANNTSLYINAMYFNFTTIFTVGYGDIHANNTYERLYSILLMIVGVLFYSFAISSLSNLVVKIDKHEKNFNKRMELIDEVKAKFNLSDNLYRDLQRYLTYDLQINRLNKKLLLNELPQQLKYSLISQIYKQPIELLNFFKNSPNDFIYKAVIMFKETKFYKNEFIIEAGHYLEEMYFVKEGSLLVLLPVNRGKKIKILHVYIGEHFGEIYMCKKMRSPVELKVASKTCELYTLSRANFIELNEEFPTVIQEHIKQSLSNTTNMELLAKEMLYKLNKDSSNFLLSTPIIQSRKLIRPSLFKENTKESNTSSRKKSVKHKKSLSAGNFPKLKTNTDNYQIQLINFEKPDFEFPDVKEDDNNQQPSHCNSPNNKPRELNVNQNIEEAIRRCSLDGNQISVNVNAIQPNINNADLLKGSINISYNISIQNNVNINNFLDKAAPTNTTFSDNNTLNINDNNKEIIKDNHNNISKDITKELTRDITRKDLSQDTAKGLIRNITKDLCQDTTKGYTRNLTKDYNQSLTKDLCQDTTKGYKRNFTKDLNLGYTRDLSQDLTKRPSRNITKDFTRGVTKDLTQDNTKDLTQDATKDISGKAPQRKDSIALIIEKMKKEDNIDSQNATYKFSNKQFARQDQLTFNNKDHVNIENNDNSINDSVLVAYEKNLKQPELEKIEHSPLFDFFVSKIKTKKSETNISSYYNSKHQKNPRKRSNFSILTEDSVFKGTTSNRLSLNFHDGFRRTGKANMQRLSEHHFNDILENLKTDAMVKKNPDEYFFKGFNTTKREDSFMYDTSNLIQDQIDRLTDVFESLLIRIAMSRKNI
jgi:CRP-like cAMP-binding protein